MEILEANLPGFGTATERCNKAIAVLWCVACLHFEPVFYHCHNWACPECYWNVCSDRAHRIEEKLNGAMMAFSSIGLKLGSPKHIVISPPASYVKEHSYDEIKKQAIAYAKEIGIPGGYLIPHLYRIKPEYNNNLYKFIITNGIVGGKWRAIHLDPFSLGSEKHYVYESLHFHVIGFYPKIIYNSKLFSKNTNGWIYKAVGVKQNRSCFATARYQLSHALLLPGKDCYIPFGIITPYYLRVSKETEVEYIPCPNCGNDEYYFYRCNQTSYESLVIGTWKPSVIPLKTGGTDPLVRSKKIRKWFSLSPVIAVNSVSYGQKTISDFVLSVLC